MAHRTTSLDSGYISDAWNGRDISIKSRQKIPYSQDSTQDSDSKVHTLRRVNARRLIRKTIENLESRHSGSEGTNSASEIDTLNIPKRRTERSRPESLINLNPPAAKSLLRRSHPEHQLEKLFDRLNRENPPELIFRAIDAQQAEARKSKNVLFPWPEKESSEKRHSRPDYSSRRSTATLVDVADFMAASSAPQKLPFKLDMPTSASSKRSSREEKPNLCDVGDCIKYFQSPEELILHQKRWHKIDPPLTFFLLLFDIRKDGKDAGSIKSRRQSCASSDTYSRNSCEFPPYRDSWTLTSGDIADSIQPERSTSGSLSSHLTLQRYLEMNDARMDAIIKTQRQLHYTMRSELMKLLSEETVKRKVRGKSEQPRFTPLDQLQRSVQKLDINSTDSSNFQSCGAQKNPRSEESGQPSSRRDTNNYTSTGSGTIYRQRGRKIVNELQEGDDDEEEEEEHNKRRKLNKAEPTSDKKKELRFACPYYKRNPEMNREYRSCYCAPGFRTIARLKEHLYKRHALPIMCPRCCTVFPDEGSVDNHLREDSACERRDIDPAQGFTKVQQDKLKSRKGYGDMKDEESKWMNVYGILFPKDDPLMRPSPYFVDANSPNSQASSQRDQAWFNQEVFEGVRRRLSSTNTANPISIDERTLEYILDTVRASLVESSTSSYRNQHLRSIDPENEIRRTSLATTEDPAYNSNHHNHHPHLSTLLHGTPFGSDPLCPLNFPNNSAVWSDSAGTSSEAMPIESPPSDFPSSSSASILREPMTPVLQDGDDLPQQPLPRDQHGADQLKNSSSGAAQDDPYSINFLDPILDDQDWDPSLMPEWGEV